MLLIKAEWLRGHNVAPDSKHLQISAGDYGYHPHIRNSGTNFQIIEVVMSGFGQKGPVFIQFKSGRPVSWFSLLLLIVGGLFLLVFGVWLLMIVATLLVLLLPYLWWKKRKLMRQMQAHMQQFAQQQANAEPADINPAAKPQAGTQQQGPASGLVIEGEVLQKRQEE
jgi:hypothetical protein